MESREQTAARSVFGPYTPIRQAGNYYFVSGQVGVDPITKQAAADITSQTHQVFRNMQSLLADIQLTLEEIVKTTIYVTDINDFAAVNEVYITYFKDPKPARSTVAVKELPHVASATPLKIEVEAIAFMTPQG